MCLHFILHVCRQPCIAFRTFSIIHKILCRSSGDPDFGVREISPVPNVPHPPGRDAGLNTASSVIMLYIPENSIIPFRPPNIRKAKLSNLFHRVKAQPHSRVPACRTFLPAPLQPQRLWSDGDGGATGFWVLPNDVLRRTGGAGELTSHPMSPWPQQPSPSNPRPYHSVIKVLGCWSLPLGLHESIPSQKISWQKLPLPPVLIELSFWNS